MGSWARRDSTRASVRFEITGRGSQPPWLTKDEYGPVLLVFQSSVAEAVNVTFVPRDSRFGKTGVVSVQFTSISLE